MRPSGEERRTLPRVRLCFSVRFRKGDEPEEWHNGTTRDISAAGMLLETDVRVDVSTHVVLVFSPPGERTSRQVSGFVTHSEVDEAQRRYLVGLNFVDLDEISRAHITAALQHTDIMALLRQAAAADASDLHLAANHPPLIRMAGRLRPLREQPIGSVELKHMIYTLMEERQRHAFERDLEFNFSLSVDPLIRYRVNVHSQRGNVEAAFRRIEPAIRTVAQLHLPEIVQQFAELQNGLGLITGPTGAGKTTTVAAMLNHINETRAAVIIALEHPIEYVYSYKKSVVKQREIGVDTFSFPIALREAMRQDPDVIVVGEVRDEETMKTALDAAETGHLVLATFPAADCKDAILRVIHFFRKDRQQEAALQLANGLRAILSQRLLPRADRVGLIPATEVLVNTPAVANLVRSGAIEQLPSVIQTSMKQGMHSLESSLERLLRMGVVSRDTIKEHVELEEILQRQEPPAAEIPDQGNGDRRRRKG